jgi:hypothetical protein
MSPARDTRKHSTIDWLSVEHYYVTTPGATFRDVSELYEISEQSVWAHGKPDAGNWKAKNEAHFRELRAKLEDRVTQVLSQDRGDGAVALSEIQIRLQKVALRLVERLYPPEDAPVEVQLEAQRLVQGLAGRDILRAVTDISRTLTETGRHLRLLAGKSTDIYERVGMPSIDVYIPATLEDARKAELMGRAAQQALRAAMAGEAIDIEGMVAPGTAYPVAISPAREVSPIRLDVGL